ncbi:orotidine 5'-phosphate decarboxylase [Sorangium cellulosum]|uniref:Orotidine 5'-phosphate decarboxylase n=1 Tax=Sorangium cellulosum TaxID=56 RepID=A0A2L0EUQ3_SORCE|nr:orotidine-5'-phosphate decarboxylase [Sorangium cellulosum]AUX43023.1 orotidine 5'-phosphate decarboxylase [Sorangium cellulosum]
MAHPSSVRQRTSLGGSSLDEARRRLVFPLDYATLDEASAAAARVAPSVGVLKVGLELFVREGPRAVEIGKAHGLDVFLDLKLHDIPETVGRAVASAAALGVRYLTVHAGGGDAMLRRAAQEAARSQELILLAVTVLTSLDDGDLAAQGVQGSTSEHAVRLAQLARGAGIHGFVASPKEVPALRQALGKGELLVTPGIRPDVGSDGASGDDQKRIATPSAAISAGADLLVVGRPIRDAADPLAAARSIVQEIAHTLHPPR